MNAPTLGWRQRHMLEFCRKYPGRHHIARDYETRRTAARLERRGLLKIDRAYECWVVRLMEGKP